MPGPDANPGEGTVQAALRGRVQHSPQVRLCWVDSSPPLWGARWKETPAHQQGGLLAAQGLFRSGVAGLLSSC